MISLRAKTTFFSASLTFTPLAAGVGGFFAMVFFGGGDFFTGVFFAAFFLGSTSGCSKIFAGLIARPLLFARSASALGGGGFLGAFFVIIFLTGDFLAGGLAGAFAAGVLLANTNFRAQIQADVLPFKGILLGVFFMDAGSLFDSDLVLSELPTVLTGAVSLILLKAVTVALATRVPRWMEPNRLEPYDAIKLSLLLSGGGEFAFVVLALAEKLGVLPKDLGGLLTAIVLITMAVTPLLGKLASVASESFARSTALTLDAEVREVIDDSEVAGDAVVVCG